jgi:Amt family ammonium transporter
MTLLIYPISGSWVWNAGGWLAMGFTDFAGSSVVHSVGGWASLVAAALVGPRMKV